MNNQQLDFAQKIQVGFQIQSVPHCDAVRCKEFNTTAAVNEPYLVVMVDRRTDLGLMDLEKGAEVCWMFPLSFEKFRLRVSITEIQDLV